MPLTDAECEAILNDDGLIKWYAAYMSLPAVGAATNRST